MTDEPKGRRSPRKASKAPGARKVSKATKGEKVAKGTPSKAAAPSPASPKPAKAAKPLPVSAAPSSPIGRPSVYSKELGETICLLVSEGCSVREIADLPGMPGKTTVFRWLLADPDFRDHYARAKEAAAEAMADEIIEIADDASNDYMMRTGKDGEESWVLNGEHVQRSRLRVDARKWVLAKLLPKKYGDRIAVEELPTEELTEDQIEARLAAIYDAARARGSEEAPS